MTDLPKKRSAALEASRLLNQLTDTAIKFACEQGARKNSTMEIGTVLAQHLNEREKIQVRPHTLVELLEGARFRGGSSFIIPFGKMLGCQDIAARLSALSELLGDRMAGVATFGETEIDFLFDLLDERQKLSSQMDTAAFAGYFHPYQQTVVNLCNYSRSALTKMGEHGSEARHIRKVMEEKPWDKGQQPDALNQPNAADPELVELLNDLQGKMGRTQLSAALGIHRETLVARLEGKRGTKISDEELMRKVKAVSAGLEGGERPSPAATPVPVFRTRQEDVQARVVLPAEISAANDSGPRFVLTPQNFQEHQRNLCIEFIGLAKRQMELARRALDEVTQHQDPAVRAYIRSQMMGEVHEMHFALERFSAEHPNILLETLEAERQGFELHRKQQEPAGTRRK